MRTRHVVAALMTLLMSTACGEEPVTRSTGTPQNGDLQAALQRVTDLVDATVQEVLPDASTEPAPDNGDIGPCSDAELAPTGQVQSQYGVYVDLPAGTDVRALIEEVAAYWEDQGYSVNTDSADLEEPALYLEFDGYNFEFFVNQDERAIVGGSTPCFEEEAS